MTSTIAIARRVRLRRLYRHGDDRLLVVPLDHSVPPIGRVSPVRPS